MAGEPKLRRSLSLALLTLYGLGTTIGAGIYVLTGKVALEAGVYAPVSFLVAALMAGFTAFSFAELSARYPKSAGEAVFVFEGMGSRQLATLVGLLVTLAALVSAATMARGFVGYASVFVALPSWLFIVLLVAGLGALAAWGIKESVAIAALLTLVEIGGLVLVLVVGAESFAELPARFPELLPSFEGVAWLGILSGAVLAFYAFLGFEDMVNVAEEVKNVRANMPRAIALTLALTALLYVAVSLVAVIAVPIPELAASEAPLARVLAGTGGGAVLVVSAIGATAVINGGLIQIILASRVFYGLAREGWLPPALARIERRTATPLLATALATAVVVVLALAVPLVTLAEATSLLTLVVFALVNLALLRIKRRGPGPRGVLALPLVIPLAGFVISAGFVLFALASLAAR